MTKKSSRKSPLDFQLSIPHTQIKDDSAEVAEISRALAAQRQSPAPGKRRQPAPPPPGASEAEKAPSASIPKGLESRPARQVEPLSPEEVRHYTYREVVIDRNGVPRQAGADSQEGEFIKKFRAKSERSLFLFLKGVLGRKFLTRSLHKPVCEFLQGVPPFRKLVLMPREHAKCLRSLDFFDSYARRTHTAIDSNFRLKPSDFKFEPNGVEPVWRVITKSGRSLSATGNHPFLTWEGWKSLNDGLKLGDWVAVVRKGNFGENNEPDIAALAGWMLANANLPSQRISVHSEKERDLCRNLIACCGYDIGESCDENIISVRGMRSLWRFWGLLEAKSADKFVPSFVLNADEETVRAFLYELIRHDGTKSVTHNTTGRSVEYSTISERLAQDVQHLLIKFGIHANLMRCKGVVCNGKRMPDYRYYVVQFTDYAGIVYDGKQEPSKSCNTDCFPPQWRERVPKGVAIRRKHGIRIDNKSASTRAKVRRVAEIIDDPWLLQLCDSDIGWEQVVEIEDQGFCETVAVETVEHTLTCGDIISHNTAIVSGGLPLHILIQPPETNIYFPGLAGSECRILLCGETEAMAKKNLRVLEEIHTGNRLFRAFWPDRVWENPKSQAKEWSSTALIFPRENEWPDQTIRAVGVGGAITGARPNVLIKDDLISFKAANSDIVMEEAIEWHKASRALLDTYEIEQGIQSLEFIIGTRWAVYDLYSYIIDNDPSVEVISEAFHKIIFDDHILWPEKHTKKTIEALHREHGSMFYLLYLNSVADPELVDFDLDQVRTFKIVKDMIDFAADERDERLEEKALKAGKELTAPPANKLRRGARLTPDLLREMSGRGEFFRARYG